MSDLPLFERELTRAEVEAWCAENGLAVVPVSAIEAMNRAKLAKDWERVPMAIQVHIDQIFHALAAAKEGE